MKLVVSFSGGKTSAYMCYWIINNLKMFYDEIIFIFANTGQENEETYIFINNCDKFFNLNLVWVEAVVFPELGTGNGFKRVTFKTADRTGLVFETYIAKHGIPNQSFPKCTNELKLVPIRKYLRSIGLRNGEYHTTIGIRADEQGRRNSNWLKEGILYPLIDMQPTTKEEINEFWSINLSI